MTYPSPRPRAPRRNLLESPQLAIGLVVVVLVLAAALIVPGLLGPSASPGPSGSIAPGSAAPGASPSPAAPSFVRPTPSPNPTFTSYVVRAGDTLNSIATAFGTTPRSIAWWNRGAYPSLDPESQDYEPNRLEIGWVLALIPDTKVDENNPPTPSPGPSTLPTIMPTAAPSANPTAQPTSGPLATVISHGPRTVKNIGLTFDMGGRLDPAVDIVQWLIDHEVRATLFPTGKSGMQTAQGLMAMQLAATRPDLFDFANHSWDHPDFRELTKAQMADQLTRTQDALLPIVGTTKPWFRPPFGGWNDTVRAGVGAAGWKYLVMWDVDMIDWRPEADGGPTAADMKAKLLAKATSGSIVLMHLGGFNTLEALPGILAATQTLGLEPVTLTEMLGG
ncbi:MAG: polysaccharide deacetylase family protein [Candidatus Limnocylindrales bacterium]